VGFHKYKKLPTSGYVLFSGRGFDSRHLHFFQKGISMNVSITEWNEVENDSIGPYEYWGQKCCDNRPDYITGAVIITFNDVIYSHEEHQKFKEKYEEDEDFKEYIDDIFYQHAIGDDIETEKLIIQSNGDKLEFYIPYQASVPEPDYDDYE
jgi:hypothetical protein